MFSDYKQYYMEPGDSLEVLEECYSYCIVRFPIGGPLCWTKWKKK